MKDKKRDVVLARNAVPAEMAGDTYLERWLNAYLTDRFVLAHDVPVDECLEEAKVIIAMVKKLQGME